MKITIAYLPGEKRGADALKRAASSIMGPVKVRESDRHAPYKHIYLATREHPARPSESSEK